MVDQTYNDMSVVLGMADEKTFTEMYYSAMEENPKALILVKTHPDVIRRKKKGYLTKVKLYKNILLLGENYNPIALLKLVSKVYTVTSQLGMEALLLNKEVHCFGAPFYAGWGLTKDKIIKIERRKKQLSLAELVAAVYLLYPKYVVPKNFYYKPADVFEVIEYIKKVKSKSF